LATSCMSPCQSATTRWSGNLVGGCSSYFLSTEALNGWKKINFSVTVRL
jgi:hypothetical protein